MIQCRRCLLFDYDMDMHEGYCSSCIEVVEQYSRD
jgi:ribosomal protein L37E